MNVGDGLSISESIHGSLFWGALVFGRRKKRSYHELVTYDPPRGPAWIEHPEWQNNNRRVYFKLEASRGGPRPRVLGPLEGGWIDIVSPFFLP